MDNKMLFSAKEALGRLGENKEQGCLLVSKGAEMVQVYVQDGFIIRASSRAKEGADAVELALHMPDGVCTWLRGVQPPLTAKNIRLNIIELMHKHGDNAKPKMIETARITGVEKKQPDVKFNYFLIPGDRPTERIYLTKSSAVLGRDPTADVVIDNVDVSWRHCLLDIQTRGVVLVRDLDSTNGTFVNGSLVHDTSINPGDLLELGGCKFTLNREAPELR
jgi:hypothetical protein